MQNKFLLLCLLTSVSGVPVWAMNLGNTTAETIPYRKTEGGESGTTVYSELEDLKQRTNLTEQQIRQVVGKNKEVGSERGADWIDRVFGMSFLGATAQWATNTLVPGYNLVDLVKPILTTSDTLVRAVPGVGIVYNGAVKGVSWAAAKVAGINYVATGTALLKNAAITHAGWLAVGGFALKMMYDVAATGQEGFDEHHAKRPDLRSFVEDWRGKKVKADATGTNVKVSVQEKWKSVSLLTYGYLLASHNVGLAWKCAKDVAPYIVLSMALSYALAHQKGDMSLVPVQ